MYINPFISYDNNTSVSAVVKYSKQKNANKNIKKLVDRYKKIKKKHKESKKIESNFRKELKNNKEFQELTKKRSKLRSNVWCNYRNLKKMERQLSKIVMLPIRIKN